MENLGLPVLLGTSDRTLVPKPKVLGLSCGNFEKGIYLYFGQLMWPSAGISGAAQRSASP